MPSLYTQAIACSPGGSDGGGVGGRDALQPGGEDEEEVGGVQGPAAVDLAHGQQQQRCQRMHAQRDSGRG